MRNRWTRGIFLAAVILLATGCASPGAKLVGAWEMLDEQGLPTGKKKILTEDHFAFGSQHDEGVWAGGGTWKLVDDAYFETVEYHSQAGVVGRTLKFDCQIIEGLWYHEGTLSANGRRLHVNEVWRRIEKTEPESE